MEGMTAGAVKARAGLPRVLDLTELWAAGVSAAERLAHVRAARWRDVPGRGVVTDCGPLDGTDLQAFALLEIGPSARLGGTTALQAAGLVGYEDERIHIWVPKGAEKSPSTVPRVRLHETRRWSVTEHATSASPARSTTPVAAVQGALWARSLRQATLVLTMTVQQRLARAEDLRDELNRVRRHPYLRPLRLVLSDITDGAHSMGELDFARLCREHHLPEPSRQVLRHTADGRRYLDVRWAAYGIVVEINGAGHGRLDRAMSDELRMVDLQIRGDDAVTVSVITLRIDPGPFFERLERLLRARGWRPSC